MGDEVRIVNAETGGAKGSKLPQLGWAPAYALGKLAEVYGFGAGKYDPHNYRLGYAHSLSLNALWRHLLAYQGGEDNDPESGLPHMAHAAWHCLNLIQQGRDHPELDDRFDKPSNLPSPRIRVDSSIGHYPPFSETHPDIMGRDL